MSETALTFDFPALTAEEWQKRLARELPAGQAADSLHWRPAAEPGTLLPYYTAAQLEPLPFLHTLPDTYPYVRGHKGNSNAWLTLEPLTAEADGRAAVDEGKAALAAGADGLDLTLTHPTAFDFGYLARTLDLTTTYVGYRVPANTNVADLGKRLFAAVGERGQAIFGMRGYVEMAPTPDLALPSARALEDMLDMALPAADIYGLTIDGAATADAGAAPTLQLALTLSQLVTVVAEREGRRYTAESVVGEIRVTQGLNTSFFHGIAQLRALRLLWANTLLAFKVAPHHASLLKIHCRPSSRVVFAADPHTNLLRTTTVAMATVMGGCDSLTITPFDDAQPAGATAFGRRQGRNIALLLREEAKLAQAVDPAAGSYYLESLTDLLAREAWALFQRIEAQGGYREAHANGFIPALLDAQRKQQDEQEQTGKQVRVGVNKYQK